MTEHISISAQDGVLTLQFARPEKKNALTHAMYSRLVEGFDQAASDDAIRAVLVRGCDDVFTTGNDIADFLSNPPRDETAPVMQFLVRLQQCRKPVVMAVEGLAVGVGATMLLHADVVVASESTRFQMSFVNLGLVPEAASSLLLPANAGHKLASELLLFGEPFDASTAQRAGLVTRVVPAGEAVETATRLAARLVAQPPEALALTKALIKGEYAGEIPKRMKEEAGIFIERLTSKEAMAAFQAFMSRGRA